MFLRSPGLMAMMQVKLPTSLMLELKDGIVVKVPNYVAGLSKTIEGALELIEDDQPISLPQVTQGDWHLIHKPIR